MNKTIKFDQDRDFGKKISTTFDFIKQEYRSIFNYFLYLVLPLAILGGVFSGLYTANLTQNVQDIRSGSDPLASFRNIFSIYYLMLIIATLLSYNVLITSTLCFIKLYREGKKNISFNEVFEETKKYLINNTLLTIVTGIIGVFGFLFCVLPGIYLFIAMSFASSFLIFEDKRIGNSISSSFNLIKDHWWETFGLSIILYLIYGISSSILGLPNIILNTFIMIGNNEVNKPLNIAFSILQQTGGLLFLTIVVIGVALQYFHLNEIKNGGNLLNEIDNIGAPENI